MSLRVEGPAPQIPPEAQPVKSTREHRIQKTVVHALDTAATETLDLSKRCFTWIADVPLHWGVGVVWLLFTVPAGIVTGIAGSILYGFEKVGELISGARPITLSDSFERVSTRS